MFSSGMEQNVFFDFSLYIEGTTEKVLQFKMPLKSICNKILGFLEQKNIFEHYREVRTVRNLLIDMIFVMKKYFW